MFSSLARLPLNIPDPPRQYEGTEHHAEHHVGGDDLRQEDGRHTGLRLRGPEDRARVHPHGGPQHAVGKQVQEHRHGDGPRRHRHDRDRGIFEQLGEGTEPPQHGRAEGMSADLVPHLHRQWGWANNKAEDFRGHSSKGRILICHFSGDRCCTHQLERLVVTGPGKYCVCEEAAAYPKDEEGPTNFGDTAHQ